eukprot:Skav223013  [mRNA]  locus=scaffold1422:82222:90954:- [translate_table: standard]
MMFRSKLVGYPQKHFRGYKHSRPCLSQHLRRRMMRISIKDSIGTTRVLQQKTISNLSFSRTILRGTCIRMMKMQMKQ